MHKKTKHTIWIFLIIAVIISFGIYMVIIVPDANTAYEVEEIETIQKIEAVQKMETDVRETSP